MRLSQLLDGALPGQDVEITSLSYDTRTLEPGALFFALPGYKTDGRRFIDQAFQKGAAAVVCPPPVEDPRCILTENPRRALAEASRRWFGAPGDKMTLLAVTGTNGKTTTTYLLKGMLEKVLGAKVGLIGTNQNMIGQEVLPAAHTTPESFELQELLARMAAEGCSHVVMEVSSHALVLERVHGLRFQAGVFTNLTPEHMDFHGTMESYRAAKGRLFYQCDVGVLNLDDPAGRYYLETTPARTFTYSENKREADLSAQNLRLFPQKVEFEALTKDDLCRVSVPIPGGFSVYNSLGALGCCLALGLPLEPCAAALGAVGGVKGRAEVVDTPADYTVLIDYAHTPDALENILRTVRDFTPGRVLLVFGCGGDRDRSKRPVMGAIAARLSDLTVVTSDNPRTEEPMTIIKEILAGFPAEEAPLVEEDRSRAIGLALSLAREGDTVVIAGKGHETYQEIAGKRRHLDERQVIRDYFDEKAGKDCTE